MKESVQRFGRFLSGMVMPNIGAFIAWGFITAFFIETGWFPNKELATLVDPMIYYMLPLLIGYTGGKLVYGTRGGVIGVVATMGVIVGTSIPMFIGAMMVGPSSAFLMKKLDDLLKNRIPAGFEMLINNFSLGILGMIITILSFSVIGPVVEGATELLGEGVKAIVNAGLLPITSIIVEPAKVLFLNNAINHGVFGPLGVAQVADVGKSIFYLIEANPGPGLGILLACTVFGKGSIRQSAPGAVIIHFFGGIHEIYFPYILMNPLLILAAIAGGMAGVFTFELLGAGLVAAASPGSIIALVAMAPKGGLLPVIAGVVVATIVSFLVAAVIYRFTDPKEDLEESKAKMQDMKLNSKETKTAAVNIKSIIFACDAGMGSSAMGATTLTKKLKNAGIDLSVDHCAIEEIPEAVDVIITHVSLADRVKTARPNAIIFPIKNFMGGSEYDDIIEKLKQL